MRRTFVGDAVFGTLRNAFPNDIPSLDDIMTRIQDLHNKGTLQPIRQNDKELKPVSVIKKNECWAFLFTLTDPQSQDPSYVNDDEDIRDAPRRNGETPIFSAHVVFGRSSRSQSIGYPLAVENGGVISFGAIIEFFNENFRIHFEEKRKRLNSQKKEIESIYRPVLNKQAVGNHTVEAAVKNGAVVTGVKAIKAKNKSTTFGDDQFPVVESQDIEYKFRNKPSGVSIQTI